MNHLKKPEIMLQGRWYDCKVGNGKSVSWDATTAPGSDYGYDIRMTSKDEFYGSSYLDDANGKIEAAKPWWGIEI